MIVLPWNGSKLPRLKVLRHCHLDIIVAEFFKGCSRHSATGRRILEAGGVEQQDGVGDVVRSCRNRPVKVRIKPGSGCVEIG
jgi:hypothetical protein